MAINKIVKYKLESRAIDLRKEEMTFENIAKVLSKESNNKISYSNVYRFFESYEKSKGKILERQEALKVKYVEADISTIEDRQIVIKGLLSLASSAEEDRDRVTAYKEANAALDSLDKRLGKLTNIGVNIDNSKTENTLNVVLHLPRKDPLPGKV